MEGKDRQACVADNTLQPIDDVGDARLSSSARQYLLKHGVQKPTNIQRLCWPAMLQGKNVLGVAPTGSGKTLAFIVPLLMKIEGIAPTISASGLNRGPIGLVLVPTRELALQITRVAKPLLRLFAIRTVCICGGMDKTKQVDELKLKVHIVVATPGRLIDILNSNKAEACISLKRLQYLIFDEADRMLELGFEEQLDNIFAFVVRALETMHGTAEAQQDATQKLRTCMFTATLPKRLSAFVNKWVKKPRIDVTADGTISDIGDSQLGISSSITQVVHVCAEHKKTKKLIKFLNTTSKKEGKRRNQTLILIFCNKIKTVVFVEKFLKKNNIKACALHGKMQQHMRSNVLNDFKAGKKPVLIATDVAARGLHMKNLDIVVNWDMPSRLEQYVHRVGRTGRQGREGLAYTFFTRNFAFMAKDLVQLLKTNKQTIDPNLQLLLDEHLANNEMSKGSAQESHQHIRASNALRKVRPNEKTAGSDSKNDNEGILMIPTTYSDGAINLATLPMRHEVDDSGWSSTDESDDHVEGDVDGVNEKQNEDGSMETSRPVKKENKKRFTDSGALRGVSFKDRCWMAGVQSGGIDKRIGKHTETSPSKGKGKRKWKKRGKRGGAKHKKRKQKS
eukprot:g9769.t1